MELTGENLRSALETTRDPLIQVRDERQLLGSVNRYVALALVETGDYLGIGSPRRVRHLRQITVDARPFPKDSTFWDGRGVIRFWPEVGPAERTLGVVPMEDALRTIQRTRDRLKAKADKKLHSGRVA